MTCAQYTLHGATSDEHANSTVHKLTHRQQGEEPSTRPVAHDLDAITFLTQLVATKDKGGIGTSAEVASQATLTTSACPHHDIC
jgi:hypothetical protein